MISWTAVESEGAFNLACSRMERGDQTLTALKVWRGDFRLTMDRLRRLSIALEKSRVVENLQLFGHHISNECMRRVMQAVQVNSRMKQLDLGNNGIQDVGAHRIATAVRKLPQLRVLDLEINRIDELGVTALAKAAADCPSLRELRLSKNSFGDGGAGVLAEMLANSSTLKRLTIRNCDITEKGARTVALAIWMNQRCTLEKLDMAPFDLGEMLRDVLPAEVRSDSGTHDCNQSVLSFIREYHRDKGPKEPALRTKVILVGQGRVGKTSLLNSIIRSVRNESDPSLPDDVTEQKIQLLNEDVTQGVDMREFNLPAVTVPNPHNQFSQMAVVVAQGRSVTERLKVSWWDFAGQTVFYAAHALFLSVNCVYVVVFKPDEAFDRDLYRTWLNDIRSRLKGGDFASTPVFVVATHKDVDDLPQERDQVFKDFIELAETEYPRLLDKSRFFHISNDESFNDHDSYALIARLRSALISSAMQIEGVRGAVPKTWKDLAERVYSRKFDMSAAANHGGIPLYGSADELLTLMHECDVSHVSLSKVAQLLHDWGVLLYYKQGTQTAVCFDPHWLSLALRRVVNRSENRNVGFKNGVVQVDKLRQEWGDFPTATQDNLLFVMRMNKLSFSVGPNEELLPCMIDARADRDVEDAEAEIKAGGNYLCNQWQLMHRLNHLPRELLGTAMSTVATSIQGWTAEAWWMNGVLLRIDNGPGATVRAMMSLDDSGRMQLIVRGTNNSKLLCDMSDALEKDVFDPRDRLGRIVKDRLVSCPKCAEHAVDKKMPHMFSLHGSLTRIQSRIRALDADAADTDDDDGDDDDDANEHKQQQQQPKAVNKAPLDELSCAGDHTDNVSVTSLFDRMRESPQSKQLPRLMEQHMDYLKQQRQRQQRRQSQSAENTCVLL